MGLALVHFQKYWLLRNKIDENPIIPTKNSFGKRIPIGKADDLAYCFSNYSLVLKHRNIWTGKNSHNPFFFSNHHFIMNYKYAVIGYNIFLLCQKCSLSQIPAKSQISWVRYWLFVKRIDIQNLFLFRIKQNVNQSDTKEHLSCQYVS